VIQLALVLLLLLAPSIALDHGSETLDRHYARYQVRIDRLAAVRGWTLGCDWISRNFPGAGHNEAALRARIDVPVRLLPGPTATRRVE